VFWSTFLFIPLCDHRAKCCIDGKTIECLQMLRSTYPSIFNSFPSYSNRMCKKKYLFSRTAAHIFVSSGDAHVIIMQYVTWMERQFNACQTPCSMYLSINSFRVIRCLSKYVSAKIAIYHIFVSPWRLPCGSHVKCYMTGKRIGNGQTPGDRDTHSVVIERGALCQRQLRHENICISCKPVQCT